MEREEFPRFTSVKMDMDEAKADNPQMQKLYHELGFLNRYSLIGWESNARSAHIIGFLFKTMVEKMTYFLFPPIFQKQNRVNIQVESVIRDVVHTMEEMMDENAKLQARCEKLEQQVQALQQAGQMAQKEEA